MWFYFIGIQFNASHPIPWVKFLTSHHLLCHHVRPVLFATRLYLELVKIVFEPPAVLSERSLNFSHYLTKITSIFQCNCQYIKSNKNDLNFLMQCLQPTAVYAIVFLLKSAFCAVLYNYPQRTALHHHCDDDLHLISCYIYKIQLAEVAFL